MLKSAPCETRLDTLRKRTKGFLMRDQEASVEKNRCMNIREGQIREKYGVRDPRQKCKEKREENGMCIPGLVACSWEQGIRKGKLE